MGRIILTFVIAIALSGCMGNHYGYSTEEWQSFSGQQQDEAKKAYQKLVAEKNKMVEGDQIENATEELINRNIGNHGDLH